MKLVAKNLLFAKRPKNYKEHFGKNAVLCYDFSPDIEKMVSLTKVRRIKKQSSKIRPLDLSRDLGKLRELIATVFQDDWSPEGNNTLRDLRYMQWFSPLVWLLARIDMEFRDSLTGIVWVEGNKLLGNVTVGCINGRRWFISNVAVREEQRGRGFGRRLLEAGIDLIKDRGGREVILQVRADNYVAIHLYESLGFKTYNAFTQMQFPVANQTNFAFGDEIKLPDEYEWHALRYANWPEEYELALDATPQEKQRVHPIRARHYRQDINERLERWLDDLLHLRENRRWAIMYRQKLVATLSVIAQRLSEPHRLKLIVHPEHRGHLERAMVSKALLTLHDYPAREMYCRVNTAHSEAMDALAMAGFVKVRTLNQMYARFR